MIDISGINPNFSISDNNSIELLQNTLIEIRNQLDNANKVIDGVLTSPGGNDRITVSVELPEDTTRFYIVKSNSQNTGPVELIDSTGSKGDLKGVDNFKNSLQIGFIRTDQILIITYDGTNYILQNPSPLTF